MNHQSRGNCWTRPSVGGDGCAWQQWRMKSPLLLEVRGVDAHMSAPFEICSKRSVVAVLASGVVISLTALTGGIAPAFAKPDTDQVVTTTAPAPEPKVQAPEVVEAPPPKDCSPIPAQMRKSCHIVGLGSCNCTKLTPLVNSSI